MANALGMSWIYSPSFTDEPEDRGLSEPSKGDGDAQKTRKIFLKNNHDGSGFWVRCFTVGSLD